MSAVFRCVADSLISKSPNCFGNFDHPICTVVVDGEIAVDDALSPEIIEQPYPFSALKGGANVLIFPDLASANIVTKCWLKSVAAR